MILNQIVEQRQIRLQKAIGQVDRQTMKKLALQSPAKNPARVYRRFRLAGVNIIGEVKKASPSKGVIDPQFDYRQIAHDYENGGVAAISVLTEPDFFQGRLTDLKEIAATVSVPVLRKDFIIDEYMIYQAKAAGAAMILLIVAILTPDQVRDYLQLAHRLGLAALVEVHNRMELAIALAVGAEMIGVNNRDLRNFAVAFDNCLRLRSAVPTDKIFVAESGISNYQDVARLQKSGVNGMLIGETLMRASDKVAKLRELRGEGLDHD